MLKKSITYTDLNGDKVTEDHYFHLSKADLVELEMNHKGGLASYLKKIVDSEDGKAIISEFKSLILTSYGVKSEDGRRFIKSPALREEFLSSEAYSTLFIELCTDAGSAAEFINGIVPKDMSQDMAKLSAVPDPGPFKDEAQAGEFEEWRRTHPSDPAAQPQPGNVTIAEAATKVQGRNVFEGQGEAEVDPTAIEPRVLTRAELTEMDEAELRSGLAEGRYKLS